MWKKSGKRFYRDPELVVWETECLWLLKGKTTYVKNDTITMELTLYFKDKRRRDTSNYLKVIEDMIVRSGWISDDSEITDHILAKRFDESLPRIEVMIH